ncbi:uncharacterized protein LOC117319653 [Pecten maximus]|uniref:uncharacterized protein LOC117319653 n=1 Tax=Pecten maximus TaxID=6579 RepID=UPI001458A156|nr:uncharacterized protein LOC117319653 [Pecten maximus]
MSGRGKGQPRGRKRRAPEDINDTLNSAVSTTGGNDSNWDPNKPENWTIGELRTRLLEQNIRPPCGFTKTMLVKLYKENNTSVSDGNSDVTPPTENDLTQPGYHSRNLPSNEAMKALQAHVTRLEQLILCQNTVAVGQAPAVPGHVLTATSTTSPTSPTLEPPAVAGGIPNNYVPQPAILLQQTGISSESLPSIEVVPQAIRQQIIEDGPVPRLGTSSKEEPKSHSGLRQCASILEPAVRDLWNAAVAHSTRTTYTSGVSCFKNFILMNGINDQASVFTNVTEELLILFVTHCYHNLRLKYSTIKLYLYGIKFHCTMQGLSNPLVNTHGLPLYRLQTILRGLKKLQGTPVKPRLPITFNILSKLCSAFRQGVFDPATDTTMEAACCVAFFAFLRCGEFTCTTNTFDSSIHLCISDIQVAPDSNSMTLRLKASKTDPFRQGVTIHLFRTHHHVCAVAAVIRMLTERFMNGCRPSDPLFSIHSAALTRHVFIDKLRQTLIRLGLNHSLYTVHSFRIGAATTAAQSDVPDHLIKVLGRWQSDSYCRYIRTPHHILRKAQAEMCKISPDT